MVQRGFGEAAGNQPPTLRLIAANLRRLRSPHFGRQISQRELALKAGLGHNAVARLEKYRDPAIPLDDYSPNVDTLDALAEVLGVEVVEFFRNDSGTVPYLSGPSARLHSVPG